MKTIIKELLYILMILIVQMLFFIYFIKQGWTLKELICSYAFLICWGTYLLSRIIVFLILKITSDKNKNDL